MRLFHPHYHTLGKTHNKIIPLFMSLIILVGLVLCLIVFNITLFFVKNTVKNIENTFDITLQWDKILFTPDASVHIYDLSVITENYGSEPFSAKHIQIQLNVATIVKVMFSAFDDIPMHQRLDVDNKSLDFVLIKSIQHIQVDDPKVNIVIQEDITTINTIIDSMFSGRFYPKNASLHINNSSFLYKFNNGKTELASDKVHVRLNENTGIIVDNYLIRAQLHFLANQYKTIISGNSYMYDVEKVLFKHTFQTSDIQLNRYLTLMPLGIVVDTFSQGISVGVHQKDTLLFNVSSSIENTLMQISSSISSVSLKDIIRFRVPSQFNTLLDTTLNGYFSGNFDTKANKADYVFILESEQNKSDMHVNINLEGNEQILDINSFLLTYRQQIIDWDGYLNVQTMVPYGTIKSYIDSPFVSIPLHMSIDFSFDTVSNTSKAYIHNFRLHSILQSNFTIAFNYTTDVLQVYEEGKTTPVIQSRVYTIPRQNVSSIRNDSYVLPTERNIYLEIYTLNLKVVDGWLFNNDTIQIFSNVIINGTVNITTLHSKLQKIDYTIDVYYETKDEISFKSEGTYTLEEGFQAKGELALNTSLNVQFETTDDEKRIFSNNNFHILTQVQYTLPAFNDTVDIRAITNENEVNQLETENNNNVAFTTFQDTFVLHGTVAKESISVYLDNIFTAVINFDTTDTSNIFISFDKFTLSGFKNTLDGDMSIVFHQNTVSRIESQVTVSNDNFIVFQTDVLYENHTGTIQNLILASEDDIFRGTGIFVHDDNGKGFSFEITETNHNAAHINADLRKVYGSFNSLSNTVRIHIHNLTTSLFTKKVVGVINATLDINLDLSYIFLSIENIDVTMAASNDRYIVNGKASMKNNELQLQHMYIQRNDVLYKLHSALFSKKTAEIEALISSVQESSNIPTVHTRISLSTQNSLMDLRALLQKTTSLPIAEGKIIITPFFETERKFSQDFTHTLFFKSSKYVSIFTEQQNKLYLTRTVDGAINGKIGNRTLAWNMLVSGSLFEDDVRMRFDITDIDIAKLVSEASIQEMLPLTVSQGKLQGTFFMRGTLNVPQFYASVKGTAIELYYPQSEDIYSIDTFPININNNHISISNALLTTADAAVLISGTGYLNDYSFGNLTLNFFSLKNYLRISELPLANVMLTGFAKGSASLHLEPQAIKITGDIYLKNTSFYIIDESKEVAESNTTHTAIDINVHSENNVVYYWPSPTFPLLKSILEKDQTLNILYNSSLELVDLQGTITLQSGLIYYFNKGFKIIKGKVVFNKKIQAVPIIEDFEATYQARLNNQSYVIQLSTQRSAFDDLDFTVTSTPSLSNFDLNIVLGTSNFEDNNSVNQSFDDPFDNVNKTLASFGDQLSNIGISQFEQTLTTALDIDYLSFKTKIFKNLVEYSSTADIQNNNTLLANTTLASLVDGSSIEIGKYIELAYVSFILEIRERQALSLSDPLYGNFAFSPQFNVEIPTPIVNVGWSFNFASFINNNTVTQYPLNTITLSWQKRY